MTKQVKKNNLIYGISDIPGTKKELFIYAFQQVMAVFVATVLIANICGTPISSCLFGACVGTLLYQKITNFKSPMFISSSGATCSAVIGALAIGGYSAVAIGGFVVFLIYSLFSFLIKAKGVEVINKIFPSTIVGAVTIVIGANLATFIPTYVQVSGEYNTVGVLVAIATMIVIAITSHYGRGFLKTIPFLVGLVFGYVICIILTISGIPMIDVSIFKDMSLISLPDFAFLHFEKFDLKEIINIIILFIPVSICALLEHISDHKVLSNIIGTDLTKKPGLDKTLLGDGAASFLGTVVCGLPNTSYGESIATTGFSKVASTKVITVAALILGVLSFLTPFQCLIASIPSCVFGGCAMVLYGYIMASGLKTIINNKVNLDDNKNLLIVSVILTIGISGIWLFSESFAGTSLAMVVGVLLNIILKEE